MLKKASRGFGLIIILLFLVIAPLDIAGAVAPGGFLTCDGTDCSFCNLVDLVNIIIVWLFGIIFLIFAFLMAIAGWGLVTSGGNTSALEDAKSKFKNAIIGLIIVMAAWLLVDTIMRGLVGGGSVVDSSGNPVSEGEISGWGPWMKVKCQIQVSPREYSRNESDGGLVNDGDVPPPSAPPTTPPIGVGQYTHSEALAQLSSKDIIVVSSGNCSDKAKKNCTSLDGVQQTSINRLIEFQQALGSPIIVTGGTEAGHAAGTYSHANGYKIDLRIDGKVNSYITNNFENLGGSKWRDQNGNVYYRHGPPDHWDIQFRY